MDAILAAVNEKTKMVFLANPNNPTGTYLPFSEIRRLHAGLPGHVVLVLDAAYAEYVTEQDYEAGIELAGSSENVVMTRTFSKIYGLASLRLGWCYGPKAVIEAMDRIRGPFNVSGPAQAAGIAAIADQDFVRTAIAHNREWRQIVTERLEALGLVVTPSVANFVLIHFPDEEGKLAADADDYLLRQGCVLRRVTGYGFPNALRMSIGTAEACETVIGHLADFMKGGAVMSDFLFKRMTLIGIGLLGSSIALAARQKGLVEHIAIYTRSENTLARAEELGLGDSYHTDIARSVEGADLVMVCAPVGACEAIAKAIAPSLAGGAIVSDVGSVKGSVITQMQPHLPSHVHFVPGHPVAGTEESGPDAGFAELFINRWCILTPPDGVDETAIKKVDDFWTMLGSNVERMDAKHHDQVLAITSHLPHLIAYNIVGTASDLEMVKDSEVIKYSAGGFRDFTRLAASDPTMWRDVFLHNKEAALEMLGRFSEDLSALQRAIRWEDGDALFDFFSRTRSIRRSIIDAGQEIDASDFGRHIKEGETHAERLTSDDHQYTGS